MSSSLAAPVADRTRPAPLVALLGVVVLALVARMGFALWEPPFDPETGLGYDDLRAVADAYWPANLYVGGPAYLLTFLGTAVFLVVLGRGRPLAWAAAVVVAAGSIVISLVIVAEALPYAYAVDPALFDEPAGRVLVDTVNEASARLVPAIVGSQVAVGLGVALGLVATLLARSAPRWFPIVGLVYLVAFFALPLDELGSAAVVAGEVVQTLLLAGIAGFGLRAAHRSAR
ncbi:hypothetical protein [Pseudonocardia pini]|uniref:hypothetical protein n=1 Tax=Pseudonocardia pini TaxID=2758030 RepID=UPI0015F11BB4|nr:hypothetical protein [Pseudonocardia pini]